MTVLYTCGIIEESLSDTSILSQLSPFLHTSRVEKLLGEEPDKWHIYEYHLPKTDLEQFIPNLQNNVKEVGVT